MGKGFWPNGASLEFSASLMSEGGGQPKSGDRGPTPGPIALGVLDCEPAPGSWASDARAAGRMGDRTERQIGRRLCSGSGLPHRLIAAASTALEGGCYSISANQGARCAYSMCLDLKKSSPDTPSRRGGPASTKSWWWPST